MTDHPEIGGHQPDDLTRFVDRYATVFDPVVLEVEREVIGSQHGASGYTTLEQANRLAELMELGPSSRLLDIGTGPGWPGLHLAQTSGCEVVLTEPTHNGLELGAERLQALNLAGGAAVTVGAPLPFGESTFDGVTSGDVFC